jgi:hypothetical protein
MEYYIQGDPSRIDQIKDVFVKAGHTLNFSCSDRNMLYFTVKGKKAIHWCGINTTTADVIRSAKESYKRIQLPKFKIDDVLQDSRLPKSCPEKVLMVYPLLGYYTLVDNSGTTIEIPFECAHKYFDYYDEKEVTLPFEVGDFVLVRDTDCHEWKVDIFSHMTPYGDYKFVCVGGLYNQCIPFEGNKSLVGTSLKCCDQYPSICYGKT